MNRRAKRQKYRKLEKKYNSLQDAFDRYKALDNFVENQKKRQIVTISSMIVKEPYMNPMISDERLQELKESDLVRDIAMHLSTNKQLFTIKETEIGTQYDLQVVIPRE
jgi:hypothetical protein